MTFEDFDQAKAEAEKLGLSVCGTFRHDGTPVYFLAPNDSSEDELRERSFELREGRPMHRVERWALEIAKQLRAESQDQPTDELEAQPA